MSENPDIRHLRIEVNREQHRKIRLGAASKGTSMMEFIKLGALALAEKEVARLPAGDTRGAARKRRRKRTERPVEAV
jgi:hypothetical protein